MGKSFANALAAAGYQTRKHDDVFLDQRTKDEVWIPEVARQGWLALSHNKRIRHVEIQRDLAMRHGLALFFVIGKDHQANIANAVKTANAMIRFREKHGAPFMARLLHPPQKFPVGSRPGKVEMALTLDDWKALIASGK